MSPKTIGLVRMIRSEKPVRPASARSMNFTKSSTKPSTEKTVVAWRLVRSTITASSMNMDRTWSQSGVVPASNVTDS